MIDVSTNNKVNDVVNFIGNSVKENPKFEPDTPISPYSFYNDEKEFNVWRHYETGELPIDPLPWNGAEPNGGEVENCAHYWPPLRDPDDPTKWVAKFNDGTCAGTQPVACEGMREIIVKFRGICRFSEIDVSYSMAEGALNMKRFFTGNTGWRIFWDSDGSHWKLSSPKNKHMYGLHTEFATYPIGKNNWQLVNDTKCIYEDPDKVLINMSPCNSSEFGCDDGSCVPMTGR